MAVNGEGRSAHRYRTGNVSAHRVRGPSAILSPHIDIPFDPDSALIGHRCDARLARDDGCVTTGACQAIGQYVSSRQKALNMRYPPYDMLDPYSIVEVGAQ